MDDLGFKIVKTNGGDELIARIGNYEICKAAFEKALFLYPNEHLEMPAGGTGHPEIEGAIMIDPADKRGEIIKHLEDGMAIAEELEDGPTGYLIERALDEARSRHFRFPQHPAISLLV
jgi:hypothetical protein